MVKHSGKVVLQTGGRAKNYLPKSKSKPSCSLKINTINKGGKKSKTRCKNKIYGQSPKGKLCKKHFDYEKNKFKNHDKQHLYNVISKNEIDKIYLKRESKNTFKSCQKNGCATIAFRSKDDILMCKFHFDRYI